MQYITMASWLSAIVGLGWQAFTRVCSLGGPKLDVQARMSLYNPTTTSSSVDNSTTNTNVSVHFLYGPMAYALFVVLSILALVVFIVKGQWKQNGEQLRQQREQANLAGERQERLCISFLHFLRDLPKSPTFGSFGISTRVEGSRAGKRLSWARSHHQDST